MEGEVSVVVTDIEGYSSAPLGLRILFRLFSCERGVLWADWVEGRRRVCRSHPRARIT